MIHLDTAYKNNGSISSPIWASENPMLDRATKVAVVSVEFPNSMYNITSANNTLRIVNDTDAKTYNIVIAAGFYDSTTMATAVTAALTTADGAVAWACSKSATTAKFTISNTSAKAIHLVYANSLIGPALGFTADSASATSITGDSMMALESTPFIYIRSNLTGCCIVNGTATNVLAAMQVTSQFGFMSFFRTAELTPVMPLVVNQITQVNMYITDRAGTIIDTNGKHWKITLAVW